MPFIWTDQCQKAFKLLKEALIKSAILVYPDPHKPYPSFTDASNYPWSLLLTQEYTAVIDGKVVSGLFQGSQLNWAAMTKEAYTIYMLVKKLSFYLADAPIPFCIWKSFFRRHLKCQSE